LPMVGGALGSFIPIPGVGTAVGTALGGALSRALEAEGIQGEENEFEAARRFVQVAGTALQNAASAPPNANPQAVAVKAVKAAIQQTAGGAAGGFPISASMATGGAGAGAASRSGRWFRRGRKIVLVGV
jgi:hypothetical protein